MLKINFKTRGIKPKDEIISYQKFLKIQSQHSFFNDLGQFICVKFPVTDNKYTVKNIFDFSTKNKNRIAIHFSNGKTNTNQGRPSDKDFMISGYFTVSDTISVGNNTILLDENKELTVLVFNENSEITRENISNFISNNDFENIEKGNTSFLPNEKGGGVIVQGP